MEESLGQHAGSELIISALCLTHVDLAALFIRGGQPLRHSSRREQL
jgi:hypothetical protein